MQRSEHTNKKSTYLAWRLAAPRSFARVYKKIPTADDLLPGQLLVRFITGSICGSDMPYWSGTEGIAYPAEPGLSLHECVGEVIASKAPGYMPGNWVLATPPDYCGLQTFFITGSAQAIVIGKDLPPATATLVQPLATVIYGVERLGNVKGTSVLVIGFGALGHLTAWLLQQQGAKVATVDPVASPLHEKWGLAAHYPMHSANLTAATFTTPPDIVVEVVGQQEQTIADAIRLVAPRGTVLLLGVPRLTASIPLYEAFLHNVSLISSVIPPWPEYLAKAYALVQAHHEQLSDIVTHHFSFAEAQKAYETYENRSTGRLKVAIHRREYHADTN